MHIGYNYQSMLGPCQCHIDSLLVSQKSDALILTVTASYQRQNHKIFFSSLCSVDCHYLIIHLHIFKLTFKFSLLSLIWRNNPKLLLGIGFIYFFSQKSCKFLNYINFILIIKWSSLFFLSAVYINKKKWPLLVNKEVRFVIFILASYFPLIK